MFTDYLNAAELVFWYLFLFLRVGSHFAITTVGMRKLIICHLIN